MKEKFYFFSSDSSFAEELEILKKEKEKSVDMRVFYSNDEITFTSSQCETFGELWEEVSNKKDSIFSIEFLYDTPQKATMRKVIPEDPEILYNELTNVFDKRKINRCFNYILSEKEKKIL